MKKIGILTTYFATNFGAMLQPFALLRTLQKKGFDVEMIRYGQAKVVEAYDPLSISKYKGKSIQYVLFRIATLPIELLKQWRYRRYEKKYVCKKLSLQNDIEQNYDAYIVGSDQVWNPAVTGGFDDVYFGFFKAKSSSIKISYAPSAETIPDTPQNREYLKKALENFDAISVREATLKEDLMLLTGRADISVVPDPTILADPSVFDEIEKVSPPTNKRYVLFYRIRNSDQYLQTAIEYAKKKGAVLLLISAWIDPTITIFAIRNWRNVIFRPAIGPEQFLCAIRNAVAVFTPSFHGCVFSIIFHKQFFSPKCSSWNSRIENLLAETGLKSQLLLPKESASNTDINWTKVDEALAAMRQRGHNFLDEALNPLMQQA